MMRSAVLTASQEFLIAGGTRFSPQMHEPGWPYPMTICGMAAAPGLWKAPPRPPRCKVGTGRAMHT